MQALMLAAGMGKRLGKYTADNTKCMVEVAGQTIIIRAAAALRKAGIRRFIIVTGYKREKLKKYINENIDDMEIIFIDNEDYDCTNNIYSLYLAKDYLQQDDTILLESDLVFDEDLILDLVNCKYRDAATVAGYESWMDGTVTLLNSHDGIIDFVEKKDFSFNKTGDYYKTVNIYKFSKIFWSRHYLPFLEDYIKASKNQYYEQVLKAITNLSNSGLKAFKVTGQKWYEIDDAQDLEIANTLFADERKELGWYEKRYGGYWRFSDLHDFATLVNPYYPPQSMLDKMKYSFESLALRYPSAFYVQNINAGSMFDVDEEEIMVGNGAAELINSLKNVVSGRLAVTVPSFNEYLRCFEHCDLVKIKTGKNDYSLKKTDFINAIDLADTLVMINPDNPSGSFLDYDDVIEIIEKCSEQKKRIIIDESFIDFAEEARRFTLINSFLLNKYPNLIVIKSISKSYGIPGLRLGVLACGDKSLLADIKKHLPIWNINSMAEYFLQIVSQYQQDYMAACARIAAEREAFISKLAEITFLKVYDSQANFVLCEVRAPLTATTITERLLRNHRFFIKDLSSKEGFEGKQFIRIAVKDEKKNSLLIEALRVEETMLVLTKSCQG